MKYATSQLRDMWLAFWKKKEHAIIQSASVVPENDPSTLFISAGMHPLVPFLSGNPHSAGTRLADVQKCVRTGDIDEVGDATHLTFFEMLGNWSLGDYYKKETIEWAWEFLMDELKLPLDKLAVSVFAGDAEAPRDTEAATIWKDIGMNENRIAYLGKEDNWWAKGPTGPCGTDTEIFYWTGDGPAPASFQESHDDDRWIEIWNCVFMSFDRQEDGSLKDLPQRNIDTGMGLERTVAVLNGLTSVYETDAFTHSLSHIASLTGEKDLVDRPAAETDRHNSARIIVDHIRCAVIIISDGVNPSNTDQGYVLRRLLRRAIRHGRKLGISDLFCKNLAEIVIDQLGSIYMNIQEQKEKILVEIEKEEQQFQKTLVSGEKEFQRHIEGGTIDGKTAFYLYETYGFPLEMTQELAKEQGMKVDEEGFENALKAHQEKSRAGAAQKFAGGLADHSPETTALHTATHLLHAGLRKVLGDHVRQRGSNINPQRLRFDFDHPEKMTDEQKQAVEDYVNRAIAADIEIRCTEMPTPEAQESGALGFFADKYGDTVKVYDMGEYSLEICGGPHVERTGVLGKFKIKKEEASSKGVRRIKAILIQE